MQLVSNELRYAILNRGFNQATYQWRTWRAWFQQAHRDRPQGCYSFWRRESNKTSKRVMGKDVGIEWGVRGEAKWGSKGIGEESKLSAGGMETLAGTAGGLARPQSIKVRPSPIPPDPFNYLPTPPLLPISLNSHPSSCIRLRFWECRILDPFILPLWVSFPVWFRLSCC